MKFQAEGYITKATKLNEGEVDVIVSTGDIDSYGEKINVDGIDLTDFKKNNVILWAHDGFNLPIGTATKVWKDSGQLMARAKFYLKDDFPRKVYQYVVDGIVKAVSIGGTVEEWGADGITIAKMKMKEFSFVPIGANSKAVVVNKSANAELNSLARAYARKVFVSDETELMTSIKTLKGLVAALEELAVTSETKEDKASVRVVLRQAQVVDSQAERIIRSIKLKGTQNE